MQEAPRPTPYQQVVLQQVMIRISHPVGIRWGGSVALIGSSPDIRASVQHALPATALLLKDNTLSLLHVEVTHLTPYTSIVHRSYCLELLQVPLRSSTQPPLTWLNPVFSMYGMQAGG